MIVFSILGLGMGAGCVALAYALAALLWALGFNVGEGIVPLVAFPPMVICDLVYRRQRASEFASWWYHSRLGGHFLFVPIWGIGLFCFLLLGGASCRN